MRPDRMYVSLGRAWRLIEANLSAAATGRTACLGYCGAWARRRARRRDGSCGMRRSYWPALSGLVPLDDGRQREPPDRQPPAREQLRRRDARRDPHRAFAERARHELLATGGQCASVRSRRATSSRPKKSKSSVSHARATRGPVNPEISAPTGPQPARSNSTCRSVVTGQVDDR